MGREFDIREYLGIPENKPVELRICHIAALWYGKVLGTKAKNQLDTIHRLFPGLIVNVLKEEKNHQLGEDRPEIDLYSFRINAYEYKGYLFQGAGTKTVHVISCLYGNPKSPKEAPTANEVQKRAAKELCEDGSVLEGLRSHYKKMMDSLSGEQIRTFESVFKTYINAVADDLGSDGVQDDDTLFPFSNDQMIIDLNNYIANEFGLKNYADAFLWMTLGALLRNEIYDLMRKYYSSFELRKAEPGGLLKKLKDQLKYEQENHPSFKLMNEAAGLDRDLLPKGSLQLRSCDRQAELDTEGNTKESWGPKEATLAEYCDF